MAISSPYRVVLTEEDRAVLAERARSERAAHRDVLRARIVLAAADGMANAAIARRLGICDDTVRKWRARFCARGLAGLEDRPRPGRRRIFPATAEAEIKALACALPAETGVPLARWSCAELAAEAVTRGVVNSISPSTVGRWLAADAIRPWRYRSWIFPRDPNFAGKAGRALDLYDRIWDGQPLGADEYVLCADEKSQLQALHRRHRDLPPAPGRIRRQEFEYRRGGTLAYLAAYDVHAARVHGRCAPTTGITPFGELVEQVMSSEPYASAARVFWIVDNGASHNGARSIDPDAHGLADRRAGAPAHPRQLAQPGGDLLLHRATQGDQARRLRGPPGPDRTAAGLPGPLQRHRRTLRLALHPQSLDRLLQRLASHEPLAA